MRARLDSLAIVDHIDVVCILNASKPLGNQNEGAGRMRARAALAPALSGRRIECGERVVHQDYRAVAQ